MFPLTPSVHCEDSDVVGEGISSHAFNVCRHAPLNCNKDQSVESARQYTDPDTTVTFTGDRCHRTDLMGVT